ncbi:hypothetical protein C7M84_013763 [Penaeus vannamei]|uniref:Uncharacterized protein n=1 Tax=Penaeus vannamei TaxID=6689 RepID=A0A3R7NF28_PENVA|nr:hypothetical protein C7M84_013763 [Penaeus vannamei]
MSNQTQKCRIRRKNAEKFGRKSSRLALESFAKTVPSASPTYSSSRHFPYPPFPLPIPVPVNPPQHLDRSHPSPSDRRSSNHHLPTLLITSALIISLLPSNLPPRDPPPALPPVIGARCPSYTRTSPQPAKPDPHPNTTLSALIPPGTRADHQVRPHNLTATITRANTNLSPFQCNDDHNRLLRASNSTTLVRISARYAVNPSESSPTQLYYPTQPSTTPLPLPPPTRLSPIPLHQRLALITPLHLIRPSLHTRARLTPLTSTTRQHIYTTNLMAASDLALFTHRTPATTLRYLFTLISSPIMPHLHHQHSVTSHTLHSQTTQRSDTITSEPTKNATTPEPRYLANKLKREAPVLPTRYPPQVPPHSHPLQPSNHNTTHLSCAPRPTDLSISALTYLTTVHSSKSSLNPSKTQHPT